jgi:hypothetical protein
MVRRTTMPESGKTPVEVASAGDNRDTGEPGAYEVWYRDEKRILFGWSPRSGRPPRSQADFVDKEFRPVTEEIMSYEEDIPEAYLNPLLAEAKRVLDRAVGGELSDIPGARLDLEKLKKQIPGYLQRSQRSKLAQQVYISIGLAILFAALGLVLQGGAYSALSGFLYVAAASMSADASTLFSLPFAENVTEFARQKRAVSLPVIRQLVSVMVVEIFAIFCWKGGIPLKLGSLDAKELSSDPAVALVIGFIGGLAGSDLFKLLRSVSKRAVGRRG